MSTDACNEVAGEAEDHKMVESTHNREATTDAGVSKEGAAPLEPFEGSKGHHSEEIVIDDDTPTSPKAVAETQGKSPLDSSKKEKSSMSKGEKTGSGKKRKGSSPTDVPSADGKGKATNSGGQQQGLMDMFLKSSGSKKPKTEEPHKAAEPGKATDDLPRPKLLDMETVASEAHAGAKEGKDAVDEQLTSKDGNVDMILVDDSEESPKDKAGTAAATRGPGAFSSAAPRTTSALAPASTSASKTSCTSKKAKSAIPLEEKNKKIKYLMEELEQVAALQHHVHGDNIPFLRPNADDSDMFEGVCTTDEVLTVKTRQAVARVIEGSSKTACELAEWLHGCVASIKRRAAAASEDAMELDDQAGVPADLENVGRFQEIIQKVGELVDGYVLRPEAAASPESSTGDFVKVWSVKNMADIPADNRAVVESHRKMAAILRERIVHVRKMMVEIERSGKDVPKMEKALLAIKDKYGKLEDASRKNKEKLEAKIETERRKNKENAAKTREKQEREKEKEKEREKQEREKQEAREKLERERQEEVSNKGEDCSDKQDEDERAKEESKEVKKLEKQLEKLAKELEKKEKKAETKKQKKVEEDASGKAKQASFMANFFAKKSSPSKAEEGKENLLLKSSIDLTCGKTSAVDSKPHTNFHPFEKPANAIVAGFPYGPGEPTEMREEAPEPTIESWTARWKKLPPRQATVLHLRDDGTPHKTMKLFSIHMRLPLVRTQLLDVDVDSLQKVLWDVEENSEEQLDAILEEAVKDEDGLYHWRGKMLQFVMEGGGYFDCRRPPFWGTFNNTSAAVTGRTPLGQEVELDYSYESDCDWESEAGDGEDLGSDIGEDEDEDEDEDEGGFVVPDNEFGGEDTPEGVVKKKVGKLTQIMYNSASIPPEMADMFAVRLLSDLPLVLANDKNIVFEEDADYEGCDVHSCKAANIEAVMYALHRHPTACAFTFIPPHMEHKYAGWVFLKNADAPGAKFKAQEHSRGLISGYIKDVSETKLAAIEAARLAEIAAEEKARKDAIAAAQAAAWAELQRKAAAMRPPPEARKEKAMPEDSMTREQLVAMVAVMHGSPKSKADLSNELHNTCKIPKSTAGAILMRLCQKKEKRWMCTNAFVEAKNLAEAVAEAWDKNSQEPIPEKRKNVQEESKDVDGAEHNEGEQEIIEAAKIEPEGVSV